jgi:hypothetical protein
MGAYMPKTSATQKNTKRPAKQPLLKRLLSGRYAKPAVFALAFMVIGGATLYLVSAATTSYSFWSSSTIPRTIATTDSKSTELGLRFKSSVAGYVTGVRFYKSAQNTGAHTGSLWDAQGNRLASVAFTNETSNGWQTATFATPVSIAANVQYIVSYHAPAGHYSRNSNYFKQALTKNNLTALRHSSTRPNGVFVYSQASSAFPTQSGGGANYWVDVVFNAKLVSPDPAPAAPTGLTVSAQPNSVILNWQASQSANPISGYNVYRNGQKLGSAGTNLMYTDNTIQAGATYAYQVQATDSVGASSVLSPSVSVTIATPSSGGTAACGTVKHVPGGYDGMGGCWPGPDNTGPNAVESSMAAYTGSCTISTANTTIDSKVINCSPLEVNASGLVVKNSYLKGGVSGNGASFRIEDSLLDNAVSYPACADANHDGKPDCAAGKYACGDPNNQTTDCGVTGQNFTILRTEIINSNRAAYCESTCLIQDSYFHGTNLWPDVTNLAHASSVRNEQYLTLHHNSLACDYTGPFNNDELGCSADMSGYPDFVPIQHSTIDSNLFIANPVGAGFCAYGGSTNGKPYSSDPTNGTYIVFKNNVFQRGANGKCGTWGAITDFNPANTGNAWTNNTWDDGATVNPE